MSKILPKYMLGTLVILMVSISAVVAKDSGTATDAGKKLFTHYGCYECHGYEGQGGFSGPRIAPTPYSFKAFLQLVRKPVGVMPAFSPQVLPDADIEKIHAYVASIPAPPPLEDIPALSRRLRQR